MKLPILKRRDRCLYMNPILKINNSKEAAIYRKDSHWKDPGAAFYDRLLRSLYFADIDNDNVKELVNDPRNLSYQDYLKEAYLVAPISSIKNSPHGVTPYSRSGCKYPHHEIKGDELVVNINGLRAAYARARQMKVFRGPIKEHLMRHFNELDLTKDMNLDKDDLIEENFNWIESFITENAKSDTEVEEKKKPKLVPIFGISKSYSDGLMRVDGTPKTEGELKSTKFSRIIRKLTRGDNYSHALVSLDDTFTKMYSYEDEGFVVDNITTKDSWLATKSIYITVMFVEEEARDRMQKFIDDLLIHQDETEYANINLLKAYVGKPIKMDKRFVCSSFAGYIMAMADSKNVHRDYSRLRPEDVTILPRAFYVMNLTDRIDFTNHHKELRDRVRQIYREHKEEIMDYNNQLPKLLLKEKMGKMKTIDKIIDSIIRNM